MRVVLWGLEGCSWTETPVMVVRSLVLARLRCRPRGGPDGVEVLQEWDDVIRVEECACVVDVGEGVGLGTQAVVSWVVVGESVVGQGIHFGGYVAFEFVQQPRGMLGRRLVGSLVPLLPVGRRSLGGLPSLGSSSGWAGRRGARRRG